MTLKEGDQIEYMGVSRLVLGVYRYTGHHPDTFDCVLKITNDYNRRGWNEVAYQSNGTAVTTPRPQP